MQLYCYSVLLVLCSMRNLRLMGFIRVWHPVARHLSTARQSLTVGSEHAIRIDDLMNMGLGVGRKQLGDGSKCVIMVPLVLPGEEVTVRITQALKSYCVGELVAIAKESTDRVEPPCPYYTTCGGCQYQHMNISSQRRWKQAQVKNALQRIGGLPHVVVNETIGTEHSYGYRAKLTPHYRAQRTSPSSPPIPVVGFKKRSTNDLVDVEQCMIATDRINAAFADYRRALKDSAPAEDKNVSATAEEKALLLRESPDSTVTTDPTEWMTSTLNGLQFRHRAGAFFQTNAFVLPLLVEHVVRQAVGREGEVAHLVDAYCGAGLFALSAAAQFQSVHGVEVDADAVTAATLNARLNKIKNANFVAGKAQRIFASIKKLSGAMTTVIVDPPRAGCDKAFIDQLVAFQPRRIVYVSCDPATQARDVKILVSGGYKVTDATPVDMFPQTRHIECVVTLER